MAIAYYPLGSGVSAHAACRSVSRDSRPNRTLPVRMSLVQTTALPFASEPCDPAAVSELWFQLVLSSEREPSSTTIPPASTVGAAAKSTRRAQLAFFEVAHQP
jgi:hypothetical protein